MSAGYWQTAALVAAVVLTVAGLWYTFRQEDRRLQALRKPPPHQLPAENSATGPGIEPAGAFVACPPVDPAAVIASCAEICPIPMILYCPECNFQHIDAPDDMHVTTPQDAPQWTNPPHRTHLCLRCGHEWRPANVSTTGVATL